MFYLKNYFFFHFYKRVIRNEFLISEKKTSLLFVNFFNSFNEKNINRNFEFIDNFLKNNDSFENRNVIKNDKIDLKYKNNFKNNDLIEKNKILEKNNEIIDNITEYNQNIYEEEEEEEIEEENEVEEEKEVEEEEEEIEEENEEEENEVEEEKVEEEEKEEEDEEEGEMIEDDIDVLLYTNNLNYSLIGELWNSSANSYYKNKEIKEKNIYTNENNSNYLNEKDDNEKFNEEKVLEFNNNKFKNNTYNFINDIYEEEKKGLNEMKKILEVNEDKINKFDNSTLCRLRISEELAKKYTHASKETKNENIENIKRQEKEYKKLIDKLNPQNTEQKKKKKNINYDTIETIRILDIDSLSCNVLNHLFAYKIVKNCSAEVCLKIITRLGMYRDKYSQVSYENMINYLGKIITNEHNVEIIALFCRCYETVSIPFLVNYVRKYGVFSRSFIVKMYDKYFKKRLFDFVRYEHNMGIRKIPNILTHPYHLSSYIKLLGECSAKKDMYIQLKMKGFIPENEQYMDKNDILNTKTKKINIIEKKKYKKYIDRPLMYDIILSSEYTGLPIEYFLDKKNEIDNSQDKKKINDILLIQQDSKKDIKNEIEKKKKYINKNILNELDTKKNNIDNNEYNENVNFILNDEYDTYLYKKLHQLNNSSYNLQTTLVKQNDITKLNNKFENFKKIEEKEEVNNISLWDLPWKTKMKNSFYFKNRFFKIVENEGWKEIEQISKKYIKPKRKRTRHSIRRKRILQKKIKINIFKKKILEKYKKNEY